MGIIYCTHGCYRLQAGITLLQRSEIAGCVQRDNRVWYRIFSTQIKPRAEQQRCSDLLTSRALCATLLPASSQSVSAHPLKGSSGFDRLPANIRNGMIPLFPTPSFFHAPLWSHLQGGSGFEGLLANIRDILWIPITQEAFRYSHAGSEP